MDQSKCHLNTVYVKPEQRMAQGPYQSLKSQIAMENFFNPSYTEKNKQQQYLQTLGELKKLMSGNNDVDKQKIARIHAIKLTPVVNQNFISSFDQNQYQLQPQDKVKIIKQKVFRVQNYYNYLYQLKSNQKHIQTNKKIQKFLQSAKQQTKLIKRQQSDNQSQRSRKSHMLNNDFLNQANSKRMNGSLAPEYRKFQDRKVDSQRHFLKESQRRKVEEYYGGGNGGVFKY